MIKLLFLCVNLTNPNKDTLPTQLPLLHPIRQADFKYISSEYGWRIDPITQDSTFHEGIDIATISTNAMVYATADGIVKTLDYDKKRGLFIIINHAFGFQTQYFHLNHFFIREGQSVKAGEKIGLVGNTGRSTATHLHYEVLFEGVAIDPLDLQANHP
ncbi:MAG: M23 family metallopeptidase [Saprospiraceae bacterium]